jgi:hypothetical protein
LLFVAGCGSMSTPTGGVSLTLDIPNAALDPKGYTLVDVTLHTPTGDIARSAPVEPNNTFDLGDLDKTDNVWVEAVLRNDSGTAVGYGRTAGPGNFEPGTTITVPVRRPILYFAGQVEITDPNTMVGTWSEVPATFSDLSVGTTLDGSTQLGSDVELMVGAGPDLFMVKQTTSDPNGALTGPATILPVSTGDHSIAAALAGTMTGGVQDGAGTDDGQWLIIGTTTDLWAVDTQTGAATSVGSGNFSRVAMINSGAGTPTALAINNRGTPCNNSATLVSVTFSGTSWGKAATVATGGFSDVAADAGIGYYVDACKGEFGSVGATSVTSIRTSLGKPTALVVSNGQAWIGVESGANPAVVSLLVTTVTGSDTPHELWSEPAQQVLSAPMDPGVQRQLDASTAVFNHLEVGAGGDYVAATIASTYHGDAIEDANFPEMDVETEELRVFDAASGGIVQRYRSWCDGSYLVKIGDIDTWECAVTTGQTAPANINLDHKIASMTFLFGKK